MSCSDCQRCTANTVVNAADDLDLAGREARDTATSLKVQGVTKEHDASNLTLERGSQTADCLGDDGGALAVGVVSGSLAETLGSRVVAYL